MGKSEKKQLRTPSTGGGTEDGQETATTWQYYEAMHAVLGARPAMDPPLLVEACAEEDNDAEPSTSAMPAAVTSPLCRRSPPSHHHHYPQKGAGSPILYWTSCFRRALRSSSATTKQSRRPSAS
ncbi:uncharacterized protein PAE49_013635 isoform 1-T2 [Odontesthes bonariensis]